MSTTEPDSGKQQWHESFEAYKSLIRDPRHDADYLRRTGVMPHIIDLIGDVSHSRVLDAGCGTGWLFDEVSPAIGDECDLIRPAHRRTTRIRAQCQDIRSLTYDDETFDVVVSSLVLMWIDDLTSAFREAYRVTRAGGRLVVALIHPYFHTNGHALHDGSFLIDRPLSRPVTREVLVSGIVGPLTYYARPLFDYYNAAVRARWQLTAFRDHFIDLAGYHAAAVSGWPVGRRTDKVPMFTFFVGRKPGPAAR